MAARSTDGAGRGGGRPASDACAGLVTLDVRTLALRDVPVTLAGGRRYVRRLRRDPDVLFAKLLGTADARFTPTAVSPRRWAMLVCWRTDPGSDGPPPWTGRAAVESATLRLRPLSCRGSWDGSAAFQPGPPSPVTPAWDGPLVVLTRSTLRLRRAAAFHRAVPAIAREVARAGPRIAFGIGEAPAVRQGTVSVWNDHRALAAFHHDSPAHRDAVRRTPTENWYAESLFARLALLDACGSIDGVPLG